MHQLHILLFGLACSSLLTACMDSHDTPETDNFVVENTAKLGAANTTIEALKTKFNTAMTTNNTFEKVNEDLIFEGVVVANDAGGNLYQTLVVRQRSTEGKPDSDHCLQIGIKHTALHTSFPVGAVVRINLNGLYIGNYSRTPKVGEPYYTSAGNLRLGPILFHRVKTNIAYVEKLAPDAPEAMPIDLTTTEGEQWLRSKSNQNILNSPMLVTVSGTIQEVQGSAATQAATGALSGEKEPLPKIFAPKALYDAGYAVDRTLRTPSGNTITLRTSTQNSISYLTIPSNKRNYTGIISYYNGWQLQLRTPQDIQPAK